MRSPGQPIVASLIASTAKNRDNTTGTSIMRRMTTATMPETLSGELATLIRDYMVTHGVTQAALADRLGVKPSTVSDMLKGVSVTTSTWDRIASALEIRYSVMISSQS